MEKIIGVLGGMGPEATADLFMKIIRATPVKKDQDHFRVIIDSNAKILDRTPAILGTGPSPLPQMLETGLNLQKAGVDFIIIPCNTAHYFIESLREVLKIPVLDMIKLSAGYTRTIHTDVKKAGLLATDGTIASKLYHKAYKNQGIEIMTPRFESQLDVMEAIYAHIKTGNLAAGGKLLRRVAYELICSSAEAILCGCTEVSLVLHDGDLKVPVVDPIQVLAEAAIKVASGERA